MLFWIVIFLVSAVVCFWAAPKYTPVINNLCLGVFSIGLVVFCVHLHPGASYLILKKESFIFCSFFRAHEVRWDEVEGFRVQTFGDNKMVVWDFVPGYSKQVRERRISTAFAGCEGSMPEIYGFKAEELAGVMNTLKQLQLSEPALS